MTADPRLPYTSTQGWYAVLRPPGSPPDKFFQAGRPAMYDALEAGLKQHKLKFLLPENFMVVQVENLRQLRLLLWEFFAAFASSKEEEHAYWPCVSAVVDRKGLGFNNEIPNKINLKWENLTPDYPYMSYRNAYLLGEGFSVCDIRSAGEQISMDSWCNITLEESASTQQILPVRTTGMIMPGPDGGCFFCGMGGHSSPQCPTLAMHQETVDPWRAFAQLSFDDINDAFKHLENSLTTLGTPGCLSAMESAPISINPKCANRGLNIPTRWKKPAQSPKTPAYFAHGA